MKSLSTVIEKSKIKRSGYILSHFSLPRLPNFREISRVTVVSGTAADADGDVAATQGSYLTWLMNWKVSNFTRKGKPIEEEEEEEEEEKAFQRRQQQQQQQRCTINLAWSHWCVEKMSSFSQAAQKKRTSIQLAGSNTDVFHHFEQFSI